MGPLRGWAPVGERLIAPEEAYSGGRRLSLVAAMDVRGIRRHAIVRGGVKSPDFLGFVRRVLDPSLRPGKVVVLDNLRLNKNPAVIDFLRERRCRAVFIPPYSPDTNPIELAFSKVAPRQEGPRTLHRFAADRLPSPLQLQARSR